LDRPWTYSPHAAPIAPTQRKSLSHKDLLNEPGSPHGQILASARQTFPGNYELSNKDGALLPGMSARVRLITSDPHDALLIPSRAIWSEQRAYCVFVVKEVGEPSKTVSHAFTSKSVVERRLIKIGRREDDLCVVEEGLTASDRVVVSEPRAVHPGATVKPQKADSPTSAPSADR
jgi:multidrug efflux pump subunit AcrA (membrane-fusion protein)